MFCGHCGESLTAGERVKDVAAPTNQVSSQFSSQVSSKVSIAAEKSDASLVEGERKTVTALFADIKGSMELMEDIDPEEARAIVDPAIKLMIDAAHRYDGYIVQSTGDGVFAIFGAPVAHEDHPQRALYAALRMQEELKRYSAKVVADGGSPIQGRIGINTGEVVVRSIQTGAGQVEYTPIGHTTNLASRMQTLANPGSTVIAESTRKLVEGYFALITRSITLFPGPTPGSRWNTSIKEDVSESVGIGSLGRVRRCWVWVFNTMLKAIPLGLCSRCFAVLPATPSGRPNRQKTCNKCRQRVWWESLSPEEQKQKAKEKEKKRIRRTARKPTRTSTKKAKP
jgi:class 3 adenylate cyclase